MSTERCGDPLYDPFYLYWSIEDQRHIVPSLKRMTAPEPCNPPTCVGCRESANGSPRLDEWRRRWSVWGEIAKVAQAEHDRINAAREQLRIDRLLIRLWELRHESDIKCHPSQCFTVGYSEYESGEWLEIDGFAIHGGTPFGSRSWYTVEVILPSDDPPRPGFVRAGKGGELVWGRKGKPGERIMVASNGSRVRGFWDSAFDSLLRKAESICKSVDERRQKELESRAADKSRQINRWLQERTK